MLKHYVEFFFPGSFFAETSVKEVPDRNSKPELPNGAYGYHFFSREEIESGGETLKGQAKDHSPQTFIGEVLTLEQVKQLRPASDYRILVRNMECNGWGRVIKTVRGNFQPLKDDDIVIPAAN